MFIVPQLDTNSSVDELFNDNDGDIHFIEPANHHTCAGISLEDNNTVDTIINQGDIEVHLGFERYRDAFEGGYTVNGIQVIENASSGR
ncbi:hypothetical protein [Endozoicomonas sp.]|uniref:hypothetical protein n=1 Tax=Endozoicomonas sp. TaxID=1892382 RepID=UPI003AF7BF6F